MTSREALDHVCCWSETSYSCIGGYSGGNRSPQVLHKERRNPSAAANMEIPKEDRSARPEGTSIPAAAASSCPSPRGLAQPDLPTGLDPNEVPVGLIEDNLLLAELCNESLSSLHRVYKHFKRVVERSRLKSSILAVKAERLNDACALREELLEKDATITELKQQISNLQAGGSAVAPDETLLKCQQERDQARRDCEGLRQANADLEDYKESMEADLRSADKKLAENLKTIQKLNWDVERRDKEIEDLESADREVVDTVQPPRPVLPTAIPSWKDLGRCLIC